MPDWDSMWETMRKQFSARAANRLTNTAALVDALERDRRAAKVLADLKRDWHWLAGVGGTYKLQELSKIGTDAEDLCDRYMESGVPVEDGDVARLRSLVAQAQAALSRAQ